MFIFKMFFIPWIITVVVEEIGAAVWGCRRVKEFLSVLWINTVTNISVTGIRYLSNQTIYSADIRNVITAAAEIAVLIAEWLLFRRFVRKIRHPFLMSLTLNAASYAAGYLAPLLYRLL